MEVEIEGLVVGTEVVEIVVVTGFRVHRILLVVKIEEDFVDVNVWAIVVGAFEAWMLDENVTGGVIVVEAVN